MKSRRKALGRLSEVQEARNLALKLAAIVSRLPESRFRTAQLRYIYHFQRSNDLMCEMYGLPRATPK